MREARNQYDAISQVSKLSWRAIEQDYSLDKYEEELTKITEQPRNYTHYIVAMGAGFGLRGVLQIIRLRLDSFLICIDMRIYRL